MTAPMTREELATDDAMLRARALVERHIAVFGYVPNPDKIKEAIAAELRAGIAQDVPSDPLAGLAERLDRLLLTARDNERFILSTESAKNIVGIVREWLRVHSSKPATTDAGALADECERLSRYKIDQLPLFAALQALKDGAVALRNSAPQETRGDEPVAEHRWVIDDRENAARNARLQLERDQLRAASQQSPRLEREGIEHARFMKLAQYDDTIAKAKDDGALSDTGREIIIDSCLASKSAVAAFADAILALLSPDRGSK